MDTPKLVEFNVEGQEWKFPALTAINPNFACKQLHYKCPEWTNVFTRNLNAVDKKQSKPLFPLAGIWNNGENTVRDDEFMMRMIESYTPREIDHIWRNHAYDTWSSLVHDHERTLDISVRARNMDMCYHLFKLMYGSTLMHGIQQGYTVEFWLRNYEEIQKWILSLAYDCLLSFLEFMGVTGVQNPEQGANMLTTDFNPALKLAFERLAVWGYPDLEFPKWQGGLFGLETNMGMVDSRMFQSLYQAVKIARKLENNFNAPICEIGGGSGYVIYWLYKMGFRDLTVVDLPQISMCQGWMLRQNLSADVIRFEGEPHTAPINIVGMSDYVKRDYALVINSDSLPEMHSSIAHRYLHHVQDHADWFYSINQESAANGQLIIRGEIYRNFPKMKLQDRNIFWMRKGYTEEWYYMPK